MEFKLIIGGKTGESVCLVGKTFNENALVKSIIRRYFPKGNIMFDFSRLPRFLEEIGQTPFSDRLWIDPQVQDAYRQYINNRTISFKLTPEGVQLGINGKPTPGIWRILHMFCSNPRSGVFIVNDPLRLWRINTELKWAGALKITEPDFEHWFEDWSVDKVALEPAIDFRNQIAGYHFYRTQKLAVKHIIDEFEDEYKLLKDQQKLIEFQQTLIKAGVNVYLDPGAVQIYEQYRGRNNNLDLIKSELQSTGFKIELYRYQLYGIATLIESNRLLLADDMGLGKTLQAIGASELLRTRGKIERTMIVCPSSLKINWQREILMATGINASIVDGTPDKRQRIYRQNPEYLIINYELVFRDIDVLNHHSYGLIILDEAQRVKNYQTKSSRALQKIKSPYCYVLTGTPLENNIEELYNISRFVDPYAMAPSINRFRDRYCRADKYGRVTNYEHVGEIRRKLSGLMLRRTKADVLSEIPPAIEEIRWLEPLDAQRKILAQLRIEVQQLLEGTTWGQATYQNVMTYYQRMREVCDALEIYDAEQKGSAKLDELKHLVLDQVKENNRQAIVFTQWTRMGELLERTFAEMGIVTSYLHGSLSGAERQVEIDKFSSGTSRIFIATDAGGTGLNLQVANLVINYDIPYNPAKIAQRIGRANRHGQTESVDAVYLLLSDTIEERIWEIVRKRQQVFDELIDFDDKNTIVSKNVGTKAMWEEIFR